MSDINVTYRKLGRENAKGLAFQSEFRIVIDSRLKGVEALEVIIHEITHCLIPEFVEEKIDALGKEIAKVLWEQGWRKVDL